MSTTQPNARVERLKTIARVWMAFGLLTSALIGVFVSSAYGAIYLLFVFAAKEIYAHLFCSQNYKDCPTVGIVTGLAGIFLVFSGPFAFVVLLLYLRMC